VLRPATPTQRLRALAGAPERRSEAGGRVE